MILLKLNSLGSGTAIKVPYFFVRMPQHTGQNDTVVAECSDVWQGHKFLLPFWGHNNNDQKSAATYLLKNNCNRLQYPEKNSNGPLQY